MSYLILKIFSQDFRCLICLNKVFAENLLIRAGAANFGSIYNDVKECLGI